MSIFQFKPLKYIDPTTKEVRIISKEEQEEMLEKGILLDVSLEEIGNKSSSK